MQNTLRYLLLILALGSVSGCSVFGIATKGELEQQNTELTRNMADQERSLDDRVTGVSDQQRALDDRVSRAALQLQTIEKELYAALTDLDNRSATTASELTDMRLHFEMIQGQVQLALADLESVAETASRAETGSRQAVQLHQDTVIAERERLQDRLRHLDARISSWYEQPVPAEQLRRQLHPEVEIQSASAGSGADETATHTGLQVPDAVRKDAKR